MGIDYGLGKTNIDTDTGIRYGVINQNELLQAWIDSSEGVYPEIEHDDDCENSDNSGYCDCGDMLEPIAHKYSGEGYECTQSNDDGDIFILKSPFYTKCGFCSPCAPGAGYLLSQNSEDCKAYCFGVDWFDDGQVPYDVYSVADDSLIFNFKGK